MKIGTWLMAMVQPLLAKILIGLGLQVVTITGVVASITAIKTLFLNSMMAVPAAAFQLALLAGVGEGFGMIFGAIAFRLTLSQISNTTRILGANT